VANAELLKLTMDFINLFPEKHDQGEWVNPCNTTMCFAGHAASLAGATFDQKIWDEDYEWCVDMETGKHIPYEWSSENHYVSEYATKVLDLTWGECEYMFHPARTREELRKAVEMLSSGYTINSFGEFVKKENVNV
jgi:hypothetical protein